MGGRKDQPGTGETGARDRVVIAGVDTRRKEVHVLRSVDGGIEESVLRPVEDGQTLSGDLVRLHPLKEFPLLADLETLLRHPNHAERPESGRKGPAMVATEAYRTGWEAIFGVRRGTKPDPDAN